VAVTVVAVEVVLKKVNQEVETEGQKVEEMTEQEEE
jgi:hypothetical protein